MTTKNQTKKDQTKKEAGSAPERPEPKSTPVDKTDWYKTDSDD